MKLNYFAGPTFFTRQGLFVSFSGSVPPIYTLGTLIGYAKIEQRKSGRTCFAISETSDGLFFQPIHPNEDDTTEKYYHDAVALMDSIGFDTSAVTLTTSPPPAAMTASRRQTTPAALKLRPAV